MYLCGKKHQPSSKLSTVGFVSFTRRVFVRNASPVDLATTSHSPSQNDYSTTPFCRRRGKNDGPRQRVGLRDPQPACTPRNSLELCRCKIPPSLQDDVIGRLNRAGFDIRRLPKPGVHILKIKTVVVPHECSDSVRCIDCDRSA